MANRPLNKNQKESYMYVSMKNWMFIASPMAIILAVIFMQPVQLWEHPSPTTALTVGLQSGYPPFEFMNDSGNIVGFDVDVAELIAKKLGKTLIIKDMEFEAEILSLKQGKIDLIVSGMNITPSRLNEISMLPYHGQAASALSLIFWGEIPAGVHSLPDIAKLPNPSVSVQVGAVSEIYLSHHPEIPSKSFEGALAPLIDVKYGKSAASLVEQDVAEYLQKKHPEIKILNVPLPEDEIILGFGIGIKKDNQELFQQVQQSIYELQTSGELKLLEDKWFKGAE